MGGDDKAVRNGADDGESGADLELFRQLVAMPPKKCRRAACSSMSLCGVATSNCPNKTRKQCSGSRYRRNGVNKIFPFVRRVCKYLHQRTFMDMCGSQSILKLKENDPSEKICHPFEQHDVVFTKLDEKQE